MKKLLAGFIVLAFIFLAGCVVAPAPYENEPTTKQNGLVWRVAPTWEHFADSEYYVYQHLQTEDFHRFWFDPARSLFGIGTETLDSGIRIYTVEEFAQRGGYHDSIRLVMVERVDSSQMYVQEEFGYQWLRLEAFSGKYAVLHGATLLTDFVFNSSGRDRSNAGDVIAVQTDNKWGLVDITGTTIIPLMFEHLVHIDDRTAFARYNGRYGILDIRQTAANF